MLCSGSREIEVFVMSNSIHASGSSRLAIFIDLNNVEPSLEEYNMHGCYMNYASLVQTLSRGYNTVGVFVYDSEPMHGDLDRASLHEMMRSSGFKVILKRPEPLCPYYGRTCQQKEVDTSLSVDMVSMGLEGEVDAVLLISGDRDFRPAIEELRRKSIETIVASFPGALSRDLARSADRCIDLEEEFSLMISDGTWRTYSSTSVVGQEVFIDG